MSDPSWPALSLQKAQLSLLLAVPSSPSQQHFKTHYSLCLRAFKKTTKNNHKSKNPQTPNPVFWGEYLFSPVAQVSVTQGHHP